MKWTATEQETLQNLLTDGILLDHVHSNFPNRTRDAVYRRANLLGYGKKMDKKGITRLFFGKKARTVYKKNKIVGEPRTVSAVQEPTKQLESVQDFSNDIIADKNVCSLLNGLEANSRAVNILQEAGLIIEPSIVQQLSLHIIKCQRE